MSVFTNSPFSFSIGTVLVAKVEAYNTMGYSTPSAENTSGATVKKAPQVDASNLARGASTTKTAIELTWTGVTTSPDNGGQTVDYKVYWNQGSSVDTWTLLASTTGGATTYTTSTTLTTGLAYQFKVQAYNDFGSSGQTSAVTVYAAIAPSGLAEPSTTYNSGDSTVLINWSEPSDDGGLSITSYTIQVKDSTSSWVTVDQSTECSESAGTILSSTQCTIAVSTLMGSSYSLESDDYVVARVTATQAVGSVTSTESTTTVAQLP